MQSNIVLHLDIYEYYGEFYKINLVLYCMGLDQHAQHMHQIEAVYTIYSMHAVHVVYTPYIILYYMAYGIVHAVYVCCIVLPKVISLILYKT